MGASHQKFGEALVVNRGQTLKTKVSSIIDQGVWRWPSQRSRAILNIIRHTPSDILLLIPVMEPFGSYLQMGCSLQRPLGKHAGIGIPFSLSIV